MPDADDFPYITPALLIKLNEVVPERCPTPIQSLPEIHHYAGKRALVNLLITISDEQNNKDKDA